MRHASDERRLIQLVWWIGLIGALIATVAGLQEVALVLRALRDIHELARMTREAAEGIARNVQPISGLVELLGPAGQLDQHTRALAATAAAIRHRLGTLAPAPPGG